MEDYEEWHIDVNFKSRFEFSNNIRTRIRQDIRFCAFLEELDVELINCGNISFERKNVNDMFCSFSTDDESEVIEFQSIIEDMLIKYNLDRYFYTQID